MSVLDEVARNCRVHAVFSLLIFRIGSSSKKPEHFVAPERRSQLSLLELLRRQEREDIEYR